MIIRAKAPLRIGLAGGGTDVPPYSDIYGGAILNATINSYAVVTIEPRQDGCIFLDSQDLGESVQLDFAKSLPLDGKLDLIKGVYNRVVLESGVMPGAFTLNTYSDVPKGSGLGSSSTIAVAILGAFSQWLGIPLGEYDLAHLAWEIERKDLGMAGGKQDQYAATFGGFNFMEFYGEEKVIVNPLRIREEVINELAFCLLLYYTSTSRVSSDIIERQTVNFSAKKDEPLEAAHKLKEQAIAMKEALLLGKLDRIGEILDYGWQNKKKMASGISNPVIDEIYETARKAGASGGKISGAGGGGFMMFFCPGNTRYAVMKSLEPFGGSFLKFNFTAKGLTSWAVR
jgi:D-glycero-alpha-D-manno-heptose-7-phosphate kinase